ncbi:MAG: hypothetical protein LRY36_00795 [Alphaproteobacteria bacterium]|nr:hypothetical protein [Alphaproteobacteria bacterium]
MGEHALTLTFNNLDEAAMKMLGHALGILAQRLYESGYNLQAEPESGQSVLFVCMEGTAGAGKSTLSTFMLDQNVDGADACHDHKMVMVGVCHDLGAMRSVVAWESRWSQMAGQQNRMRDCGISNPFKENAAPVKDPVPLRLLPGVEIMEHGTLVPEPLQGLRVLVDGQGQGARSVSVTLPRVSSEKSVSPWDVFREETAGLVFG